MSQGNYGDCDSSCAAGATTAAPPCVSSSGSTCVFPFIYGGTIHVSCTYLGGYPTPWCSTKTDADGYHISVKQIKICKYFILL